MTPIETPIRRFLAAKTPLCIVAFATDVRDWDGGREYELPSGARLSEADVVFLTGESLWEIEEALALAIVIRAGDDCRGLRADVRNARDDDAWMLYFGDAGRQIPSLSRELVSMARFAEGLRDAPGLMVEGTLIHADLR